jgi:WD40 repeat protein
MKNTLITDGADSTCKVWDISINNKIPVVVYYDTESRIISADFRPQDNLHILIDEDGYFIMRNMKGHHDFVKTRLPKQKYNFVKFNSINENQYFIGGSDSIKIYDVRTNLEIESIPEFCGAIDIFNDSKSYLVAKDDGLSLFSHQLEKLKEWKDINSISHLNMNVVNYQNPEIILIGSTNGDVFISDKEN